MDSRRETGLPVISGGLVSDSVWLRLSYRRPILPRPVEAVTGGVVPDVCFKLCGSRGPLWSDGVWNISWL